MGERGPQKEPLAIKMAKGTDRAADRRTAAARAPIGIPAKPPWLESVGDIASETWDERIAELSKLPGLLSTIDGVSLAHYCLLAQRVHDAQREIESDGITCSSDKGGQYQHPAVGIQNKAIEMMNRIGAQFAMTPSTRASLHLDKPQEKGVRRWQG